MEDVLIALFPKELLFSELAEVFVFGVGGEMDEVSLPFGGILICPGRVFPLYMRSIAVVDEKWRFLRKVKNICKDYIDHTSQSRYFI